MSTKEHHTDGCEQHNAAFETLWRQDRRRALLYHLAQRWRGGGVIQMADVDHDPERTDHPFSADGETATVERPGICGRDPVPVVVDRLLVLDADRERALKTLNTRLDSPEYVVEDRPTDIPLDLPNCCDIRVFRRLASGRSVPDAIRALRLVGIDSGPNHIAMLAGTDKGGVDPQLAEPLPYGETSTDGPLVVVIDTGIDADAPRRTDGWLNGVRPGQAPFDIDLLNVYDIDLSEPADELIDLGAGHGTFVAGVVRQVCPSSDVVVLKALDTHGIGTELELANAICRAARLFDEAGGRGVLNISMGMETVDWHEPFALACALDQLPDDVVVVAAAGNKPTGVPWWPAASDRVFGVASHGGGEHPRPSPWSNYGSWVSFSARGECVVSTFVEGTETTDTDPQTPFPDPPPDMFPPADQNPCAYWSGTSFATPQVAGLAATFIAQDPTINRLAVERRLRDAGRYSRLHGYLLPEVL